MKLNLSSRKRDLLLKAFIFLLLTVITQIGGLVYLLTLYITEKIKFKFTLKSFLIFILFYALTTFIVVPFTAPIFGRVKIENGEGVKPINYWFIILNRNYVVPELNELLKSTAKNLKNDGSVIEIRYLDANFPFINGFPLLPHSTHSDGRKIDFGLIYENEKGEHTNLQKSRSGYGVFTEPQSDEINQATICKARGYFYYEFPKYLTFGKTNKNLKFSESGTKILILSILEQNIVEKIFIEPNLKIRLNLTDEKIRFQGCRSVRHDDHIHLQIK